MRAITIYYCADDEKGITAAHIVINIFLIFSIFLSPGDELANSLLHFS